MLKNVLAVVLGVVVAIILIMIVETVGHTVYPPPSQLDMTDMAAMSEYIDTLPLGALLFVMGAWLTGTLVGGLLACIISSDRPMVYSAVVGGMILFATVITLIRIPHPMWFSITSVIGIVLTTYLAGRIGTVIFSRQDGS
jgi:hypothetical protein